jgi:hypothetical protein
MDKWNLPVDVICDGELTTFKTRKIARDFFYECMLGTDGSERDRYTNIFIDLEETDKNMVHDGETWEKNPKIRGIGVFKGDHIGDSERFVKPITYSKYIRRKTKGDS